MPTSIPVPARSAGDLLTSALWNAQVKDNINKLLERGHRVLTVAQFGALTGLEDGDEVYLEVDASNGIVWHLRYVAAETTYKWRFLGGPDLVSNVQAAETTASNVFTALLTPGPSITVQHVGDYDIVVEGNLQKAANANAGAFMSVDLGAAAAVDNNGLRVASTDASDPGASCSRLIRRTLAASSAIVAKYRVSGASSGTFQWRTLRVRPVRLI